ncbi:MAG: MarR family transcriptional regulator, partial [Mesorhizobium sp.]
MSGEDNLLKLVEVEEADDHDYLLQEQVGFILRKAHQRHVSIFASRIADLTPPQFAALAKLRDVGETSQNQLGTLIAMDAATVKGVIDRLKARGLVELSRHEVDKR